MHTTQLHEIDRAYAVILSLSFKYTLALNI